MIKAFLIVLSWFLPWMFGSEHEKKENENHEMDKALANNDIDTINRLLNDRFDDVRSPCGGNS